MTFEERWDLLRRAFELRQVKVIKCLDDHAGDIEPTKIYRVLATVGNISLPFDCSYELLKSFNLL